MIHTILKIYISNLDEFGENDISVELELETKLDPEGPEASLWVTRANSDGEGGGGTLAPIIIFILMRVKIV